IYADTNGSNDWRAGKLWQTRRYNDMSRFLPQVGVAVVNETYTYGGIGGRVSRYDLAYSDQVGRDERFFQIYGYDELGNTTQIGYPNDVAGSNVDIGRDRTVTNSYTDGRLTGVSGSFNGQSESWANSISYHSNGLVKQVIHSNGVTDSITNDPNGQIRIESVATAGARNKTTGVADNLSTGNFQYDGLGNVVKVGEKFYLNEVGYQPPPPPPQVPYSTPCQSGFTDPVGVVFAAGDARCDVKVFFFYTADDRLFKVENGVSQEKVWYFEDLSGQPLTEHVMVHTHYLPWATVWQSTRDHIYRDKAALSAIERYRDKPVSTLHYHNGSGVIGIVTDAVGFRVQQ
ncbi:MAG TPA: hypothetical protein VGN86_17755, partial [Pyrinomonadaceae bacterium]|nr:hypothetical protein [Pyrinomonadaceae bacterium]